MDLRTGTGYGQQCGLLLDRLKDDGHDVAVSAFHGLQSTRMVANDVPIYPGGYTPYGEDALFDHAAHHFGGNLDDGLIITLVDVWIFNPDPFTRARVACWTPIDHDPPPPKVLEFLEASQVTTVAMSQFGQEALLKRGLPSVYAPHAVDTDVYAPRDRDEARKHAGFPEQAFVVGMVCANKGFPSRKGIPEALQAFARLREKHDDALLYLHTDVNGTYQGVPVMAVAQSLGIPVESLRFPDQYAIRTGYPQETMAELYSACDVFLNPAYGEGFGVPIVEAQACGTPAIVTAWTSMPELVEHGWHVGGQLQWSGQGSWWMTPDVDEIVRCLEQARSTAPRMRDQVREWALRYDHRKVYAEQWRPILADLDAAGSAAEATVAA